MDRSANDPTTEVPSVSVAELRDYRRINAELVRLLDDGHAVVRLDGVGGQRLLAAGLSGPWKATVLLDGRAGPELAAELDAPGLTLIAPDAADGAGRALKDGRLLVIGGAGDAVGIAQKGGVIVVGGPVGHRAGLGQEGGTLILLDRAGRLCGERQSGGRIFARSDRLGPDRGRGRRGGVFLSLDESDPGWTEPDGRAISEALRGLEGWLPNGNALPRADR